MKSTKFTPHLIMAFAIGIVLPVLGSIAALSYLPDWRFENDKLHSVIECLGGFIALSLSAILLNDKERSPKNNHHIWIAYALISMGTLDIFHASVSPGNLFVWLHSVAQFTGGMLFILVCLPKNYGNFSKSPHLPLIIFLGAMSFGISSIVFEELTPQMINPNGFSFLAQILNISGGIGFLIAASYFMVRYRSHHEREDLLFAIHCSLFGVAGVLFELSVLWDAAWWWWHFLRLMAYGAVMVLIISSYRFTEKKLMESVAHMRSTFDNSPSVIYIKDTQSRYLLINRQFEKLLNIKNEDALGKTSLDIFPEDVGKQHNENDRKVIEAGCSLQSEEYAPHEDGYGTYFSLKFPIKDHSGKIIAVGGISNDITDRKRAEEKIKALSKFPDEDPQPVLRISVSGELLYRNNASLQLLETWNIEAGQSVPPSWHRLVIEVMSSKSDNAVEVVVNKKHYLMMIAYIEEANYVNVYGADITESKQSDKLLKFYTEELEHSNKDLEDFAYLASHDLQEPLRKIITFGDRLSDPSLNMDSDAKDYVARMQKAAERMHVFINDLLEYSKISKSKKLSEMIDLGLIISRVKEDLDEKVNKCNGTFNIGNLPTLEGDLNQLHILFQNLISNSLKYHKADVPPVISISSTYLEKKNTWEIVIVDNGIGIEQKYFERIFKPFERLHGRNSFEGTGIGLAICKKIVERNHGEIRVTSEPQVGTTFTVSLPQKQPISPIQNVS